MNEALESLGDVLTGDLIKSQNSFAQFLENYGWFGSLLFMSPGEGYLLKSSNEGELLYPFTIAGASSVVAQDDEDIIPSSAPMISQAVPEWDVNPSEFSGSMSVVTSLVVFDSVSVNTGDIVGAFVGGVCRGIASPARSRCPKKASGHNSDGYSIPSCPTAATSRTTGGRR